MKALILFEDSFEDIKGGKYIPKQVAYTTFDGDDIKSYELKKFRKSKTTEKMDFESRAAKQFDYLYEKIKQEKPEEIYLKMDSDYAFIRLPFLRHKDDAIPPTMVITNKGVLNASKALKEAYNRDGLKETEVPGVHSNDELKVIINSMIRSIQNGLFKVVSPSYYSNMAAYNTDIDLGSLFAVKANSNVFHSRECELFYKLVKGGKTKYDLYGYFDLGTFAPCPACIKNGVYKTSKGREFDFTEQAEKARLEREAAREEEERKKEERKAEKERKKEERRKKNEEQRLNNERLEAERLKAERLKAEAERIEAERLKAEAEAERLEAERLKAEAERLEAERLEAERLEAERLKAEAEAKAEAERIEAERLEAEAKAEAERLEAERLKAEAEAKAEAERLKAERLEAEAKAEAERLEAERLKAEAEAKAGEERLKAEAKAGIERLEAERLAKRQKKDEEKADIVENKQIESELAGMNEKVDITCKIKVNYEGVNPLGVSVLKICSKFGMYYELRKDTSVCIKTASGTWIFNYIERPIKLMHMNYEYKPNSDKFKQYHNQNIKFKAPIDVIEYIIKHDNDRIERLMSEYNL